MLLAKVFDPYVQQRPYCVMVRAALERMLSSSRLDDLFRLEADTQYERTLLFSTMVEAIARVVTRVEPSVLAAYRALRDQLGVSDEAFYQKLRGVELPVSAALVRDSFEQARGVLEALGVCDASWVSGRRVKILDGNHLAATEHRLQELRTIWDAPLPGKSLVVWDQATRLVCDVFLTQDGHAQERSLLDEVLESVAAEDVWIADRNFCTSGFLFELWDRRARFVIRQHGNLPGILAGKRRFVGRTASGEKVYEQPLTLTYQGRSRTLRRVTVVLQQPTRDGDRELHILTNLTAREASAVKVAQLYQRRWTIEVVFLELQTALSCEVQTLGYPRAALFCFCVALFLQNTMSLLNGALRAAHGTEKIDTEVSGILLSQELQKTYDGMLVAIPAAKWETFGQLSLRDFASALKELAQKLDLTRYRKTKRGPKKPPPKKKKYHNGGHASTYKLLALRKPSD